LTGPTNAFVTEFNPAGTDEVYSTYLGGSGGDSAQAIALDGNGNVYVAGNTSSGDFPITDGVLEGPSTGVATYVATYGQFGFISKLNLSTSQIQYSTFVEGQGTSVTGLAVNGSGNAYLTGTAPAPSSGVNGGFQLTPDALPAPANQGNSPFLVKLNSTATALNYATLLGGNNSDGAMAVAVDGSGNAYLTGFADSTDFPTTKGAVQTVNNAAAAKAGNAFVAKFALAGETNQTGYPNALSKVPTSITTDSAEIVCEPQSCNLSAYFTLNSKTPGPPPSGTITIPLAYDIEQGLPDAVGVSGTWTGVSPQPEDVVDWSSGYCGPVITVSFEVDYSGDPIYQASTATGTAQVEVSSLCAEAGRRAFSAAPRPATSSAARLSLIQPKTPGPKFIPPPAASKAAFGRPFAAAQPDSACLVTHAVDVYMQNASRPYGAANPQFGYSLRDLPSGYALDVIGYSTATPASPVGGYPISANVDAPPSDAFQIHNATLQVVPANLYVTPRDAYQLAGVPYKPFSYQLIGFANGQTASVAHGTPILTTTAPAVPIKAVTYSILGNPGTLTAQNYRFVQGLGELNVYSPLFINSSDNFLVSQGAAGGVCGGVASQAGQIQGVFQFAQAGLPEPGKRYKGTISLSAPNPGLYLGAMQVYGNCTPANSPSSINTNPPAELLVSIPIYGEVSAALSVFEPGTQVVLQPQGAAKFADPEAVALDGNGALYVADTGNNRIVKVTPTSRAILSLGSLSLKAPSALAVDGAGNLDIADTGNNRIVQFTPSGQASVVPLGTRTLAGPRGLIVDRLGDLLIADTGHNRVLVVEANGLVSVFATGKLKLSRPNGLATDAAGDVFVADTGNNRIVKITSAGSASVVPLGTPAVKSPVGIGVDAADSLYITQEAGKSLVEISPAGIQSELLPSGLSDPRGITMDPSGTLLYIADSGNSRVVELVRSASPKLSFGPTMEGKIDAGGPKATTIRNIGSQPLKIFSITFPPDFPETPLASASATECKAGVTLAESASCSLAVEFKPIATVLKGSEQLLKETVLIVSDANNGFTGHEQEITVEGTEIK
jgi:sugar lactone lactonase YvrE